MEEIHMLSGLDQALPCPNGDESSSSSDQDVVQFGQGYSKQKSREYLQSILGTSFTACADKTPAWYYRVISVDPDEAEGLGFDEALPKLSTILGLSNVRADKLLLDCGLIREMAGKLSFLRSDEWDMFRTTFDLHIEFDQTKSTHFNVADNKSV